MTVLLVKPYVAPAPCGAPLRYVVGGVSVAAVDGAVSVVEAGAVSVAPRDWIDDFGGRGEVRKRWFIRWFPRLAALLSRVTP